MYKVRAVSGGTVKVRASGGRGPTGPQGLPGVNAVANDTATATYVETPGSATATALSAAIARSSVGTVMVDASETDAAASDIYPIGSLGGVAYGSKESGPNTGLYRSTDGTTWTKVNNATGYSIHALGDGEVLLNGGSVLLRSTGWASDPLTATFATVATANGASSFIASDVDTFENIVIAAEYAVPRNDARYVKVSVDNGQTFTNVRDLNAMHPADIPGTHWHAVCVDGFHDGANPRLWASYGDGPRGVIYSDDLGTTWTVYGPPDEWQPMPLMATPNGIVTSTDQANPDGVWLIPRDLGPRRMLLGLETPTWLYSLLGFGTAAHRDEATGIVYIYFRIDQQVHFTKGLSAVIFATDGETASILYQTVEQGTVGVESTVQFLGRPAVLGDGTLLASYVDPAGSRHIVRGHTRHGAGVRDMFPPQVLDRSSNATGANVVADSESAMYGTNSRRKLTTDGNVALVGVEAEGGDRAVAIGYKSDVNNLGVGIGFEVVVAEEGTGVGAQSNVGNGVGIGKGLTITGTNAIGIGRALTVTGANATCIAPLFAQAEGSDSVALGTGSSSSGSSAVAIAGGGATGIESFAVSSTSSHYRSIAFAGYNTTADNQLMLGDRDAEVTNHLRGIILKAPGGTRYRIKVADGGSLIFEAL